MKEFLEVLYLSEIAKEVSFSLCKQVIWSLGAWLLGVARDVKVNRTLCCCGQDGKSEGYLQGSTGCNRQSVVQGLIVVVVVIKCLKGGREVSMVLK